MARAPINLRRFFLLVICLATSTAAVVTPRVEQPGFITSRIPTAFRAATTALMLQGPEPVLRFGRQLGDRATDRVMVSMSTSLEMLGQGWTQAEPWPVLHVDVQRTEGRMVRRAMRVP